MKRKLRHSTNTIHYESLRKNDLFHLWLDFLSSLNSSLRLKTAFGYPTHSFPTLRVAQTYPCSLNFLLLEPGWQGLLELLCLFRIFDHQGVQVLGGTNFELQRPSLLLLLDRHLSSVLSASGQNKVLDFFDFLRLRTARRKAKPVTVSNTALK